MTAITHDRGAAKDVLYYDGACGVCRRTTKFLRAIDWLRRLDFQDLMNVEEAELPVPRERARDGIPMRTRGGRALVGFPAVRRAMVQTPLGALPACLMYVPGIAHLCAAAYRYVVIHRKRDEACAAPSDQG